MPKRALAASGTSFTIAATSIPIITASAAAMIICTTGLVMGRHHGRFGELVGAPSFFPAELVAGEGSLTTDGRRDSDKPADGRIVVAEESLR